VLQRPHQRRTDNQELLANEYLPRSDGGGTDYRGEVVQYICEIEALDETPPPSVLDRAFTRIAKDAGRLELSIKRLPRCLRRLIIVEVKGLELARAEVEKQPSCKQRAAEVALKLIEFYSAEGVPTLTLGGPYIKLAELLYATATEKTASMVKACTRHFKGLRFVPRRHGPLPGSKAPPDLNFMARVIAEHRRRMKNWPPLEDVVDEVLNEVATDDAFLAFLAFLAQFERFES